VVSRVPRHGPSFCAAAQGGCLLAGAPRSARGCVGRHPARASRPEVRFASAGRAQPGASRSSQGIRRDRRSQVPSPGTPADAALQRSTRRLDANQSRAPTPGRARRVHRPGVKIEPSHFEQIVRAKVTLIVRGGDRGLGSGTCGSSSRLLNQASAESLGRKKWSTGSSPAARPLSNGRIEGGSFRR